MGSKNKNKNKNKQKKATRMTNKNKHNYPYYNKYNKYDSKNKNKNKNKQKKATRMTNKNKNNNKNNEKNDMERFDLGDVLSLPAPTPVGAPYPRDVTGVKGVAAFIRKLYAMVSAEEHPQICWSPEGTSLIVQ